MHITRLQLTNIKSHLDATFEFERGTTAITGTNGAGKTTIIEAIAWTLFGFLDYKKDDFVSRGEKRGEVRLTVETSDQKIYIIYRDTGSGYYVFDPAINAKIAEKGEEVTDFLRRILQVEVGTDLKELFQTAIGVPQGTFTADFLLSRELRKKKFDKLLKVEEYRNSAEKLKTTVKHIESKRLEVWEKIVRGETQLERFDEIIIEQTNLEKREKQLNKELTAFRKHLETSKKALSEFDELKRKVDEALQIVGKFEMRFADATRRKTDRERQVNESKNATAKQKEVEKDYSLFQTATENLKCLQIEQTKFVALQSETQKLESEIRAKNIELKNLRENLEKSVSAKREITLLAVQIKQYNDLTEQSKTKQIELTIAKDAKKQLDNLESDLTKLREEFKKSKTAIDNLEAQKTEIQTKISALNVAETNVTAIDAKRTEVVNSLANLKAQVEKDKQFEREVQNGLCPILSQKCLNLAEGENLSTYFKSSFSTNTTQINGLSTEQTLLEKALVFTREIETIESRLENAKKLHDQTTENGKRLKADELRHQENSANLSKLEAENTELETQIKLLGNPLEREKLLQIEAEKEPVRTAKINEIEGSIGKVETEKSSLENDLKRFANLADNLQKSQIEVEKTQFAQKVFLESQGLANLLKQRESELTESDTEVENLAKEIEKAKNINVELSSKYKQDKHLDEQTNFDNLRRNEAVSETEIKQVSANLKNYQAEILRLGEIRIKLSLEKSEESRLKKVGEATTFISDTLKKAAPEVAKMLLARISQEANLFFREITGNAERTLSWKEDYEVSLEEYGHQRPFATLSGGEQMAAALSVRLAILQELSDIRFAFFDEPTVNMDAERREKLALAIHGISQKLKFSQIFVISHDDTFESHTDYVISVGKV
jgi:DNA repair protein SbcC/Rad50